jgi:hypothetical protein
VSLIALYFLLLSLAIGTTGFYFYFTSQRNELNIPE